MLAKASSLPSTPIPIIPDTRIKRKLCNRDIWPARQPEYNSWSVVRNRRLLIPEGTWCSKIWSWELKRIRGKECAEHRVANHWDFCEHLVHVLPVPSQSLYSAMVTCRAESWEPGLSCPLPTAKVTQPHPSLPKKLITKKLIRKLPGLPDDWEGNLSSMQARGMISIQELPWLAGTGCTKRSPLYQQCISPVYQQPKHTAKF